MTFRLDPQALVDDQFDAKNKRLVSYAEADADRDGNGHFVATLVYDGAYEDFDAPEAHITRRAVVVVFDKDGERIGSGSASIIVESWWNDFDAYNRRDKERRAKKLRENPPPPEPKIVEDGEVIEDAWECACGHVYAGDDKGEPTYECGTCGESGAGEDARRCSQCHKFAAKQGDFSCPMCEAPEEDQTRVFAKLTDQGTLAAWTYPGMDRDEFLEARS